MSEPTPSTLNGDLQISQRTNAPGGGNLIVDGNIYCEGSITGTFPRATDETPGIVTVGAGLNVSVGVLSWKGVYRYKGGQTLKQGGGAYICVDDETLYLDETDSETVIAVNLKLGGGLVADVNGDGIKIDAPTAKTILELKGGAYKEVAANTGDSADANKIPELGSGGLLNYAVIPTDYVRTAALSNTLQAYVTNQTLSTTLTAYLTTASFQTAIASYVTQTALTQTLASYATSAEVTTALGSYVTQNALNNTLANYATTNSVTIAIASALSDYATAAHQHTVTPVYSVPVSGLITLERDKASYVKTITGNTVVGFDATGLNLGANDSATFELLLKMETYVYPVLFGNSIAWLNGEEPYFNEPNKSYLFAFRTYDGGQNWVGAYQGAF